MAEIKKTVKASRKKEVVAGVAHVDSTFNNTVITITDTQGNTVAWSS
ncbi:MAG: 30S ribosomal protein S11, partial [Alphaproteobacteria bacterium]|nr:30S ribosomal protein S11 [Alphaproteobacteria bacterium]